tara:strand:- start:213 stop:2132 length:1920 start_codon:yes stop_codon:yes gene_type:complete
MNEKVKKIEIFLDQLNWESFLFLFLKRGVEKILVLDKIKFHNKLFQLFLNLKGISIIEKSFFVGDLFNDKNKSIWLLAGEIVDKLAFKISDRSLKKNKNLNYLNSNYGNNTLRLFIAKNYKPKLIYWIIRGLTSINLSSSKMNSVELVIKEPIFFEKENLNNIIEGLSFKFYNYKLKELVLIKSFIIEFFKLIVKKFLNFSFKKIDLPYDLNLSSVLSSQEESIRIDQSLRNQHSWYDIDKDDKKFNSFVSLNSFYPNSLKQDINELRDKKNYVLPEKFFDFAKRKYKDHYVRKLIKKEINHIFKILFNRKNLSDKYLLIQTLFLLRLSDSLACLCLLLKTKVYLIKEPQYITSDAIQMVSSLINVKTICIQYSNKSRPSPMSMSTCDIFLIFSDNYQKVFKTKNIFPKKFIETGYPLNGIQNKLTNRVKKIKNDLKKKNVSFVIGFFDESISDINDKWGFISPKDHLKDIHILAKAVIEDSSLSVIIKNQFINNDLDKIFPNDLLIKRAKETKRFISISEGSHRNDIYPMQIALVSDFCISYKFGATAGLESAITGTRTVLVDKFNFDTAHDEIYSKNNIIYKDFDKLIQDIYKFRAKQLDLKNLGDWSSIINYFDPFSKKDNNAVKRNYKIIKSIIN